MQHHAFWHSLARGVGSLCVDVATEGPVAVAGCPGRGDGAVGVGIEGVEGHEALEGYRVCWRVAFHWPVCGRRRSHCGRKRVIESSGGKELNKLEVLK